MSANPEIVPDKTFADSKKAAIITGLKTFISKLPWDAAIVIVVSLPKTLTHAIVTASAWVGLTLPGMIEEPGSFAGKLSSPKPALGPEPKKRISWAILNMSAAKAFKAPWTTFKPEWFAKPKNLFVLTSNWWPYFLDKRSAISSAIPGAALRPVPTAVPPIGNSYKVSSNSLM